MEKVVTILFKGGKLFFVYLQKALVIALSIIALGCLVIAFRNFQDSIYGLFCLGFGSIFALGAVYIAEIK
ncbi:TPA: hypothetical protein DIC40_06215 [Patescibacteria group bacterium]|nr:hypothetical protein P148_SR1C00001G0111 [candidate division SR1 bacterium RAAC1_SR1_1]HCY21404.1 hypothetical protein [Candidatus Gracilibacteria bacterium]